MATLAAQYFAHDAPNTVRFEPARVFVFTFEAPMTLENETAQHYNDLKINYYRFEFYNDIVPLLPLRRDFYNGLEYIKIKAVDDFISKTNFAPVGVLYWYDKENQRILNSNEAANQKRLDWANSLSRIELISNLSENASSPIKLISNPRMMEALRQHSLCNTWMPVFNHKPNLCSGQLAIATSTTLTVKENKIRGYFKDHVANGTSLKIKSNGDLGYTANIIATLFLLAFTTLARIISVSGLFYSKYRQSLYFITQWALCVIPTYIFYLIANNYSATLGSLISTGSEQLTSNIRNIGKAVDLFASFLIFLAAWALATKSRLKLKTIRAVKLWAFVLACLWLALGLKYGSSDDNLTLIYLATPGAVFNTLAFFTLALACLSASGWTISRNNSGIASAAYVNPDNGQFSQSQSKCLILLFPACFLYAWLQIPAYLYSFMTTESTAVVVQGLRDNLFMGKIFFGISLLGVPLIAKLGSKFGLETWLKFAILLLAALVQLISFAKNLFGIDIEDLFKSVAEPLAR